MIRVDQPDAVSLRHIRERSFVTCDTLVSEGLEDLFQSCLRDTVFLDAKSALIVLQMTEEPANSPALLGHTEFEELTALLKHLNLFEVACQVVNDLEAVRHCLQELQEISEADLSMIICF